MENVKKKIIVYYNPNKVFKGNKYKKEKVKAIEIKPTVTLICDQDGEVFETNNIYYPHPKCPKCGCSGTLLIKEEHELSKKK